MSTPKDIINELKTILAADATLKAYVQKFEIGLREGIPDDDFPIIMIEPDVNTEELFSTDQVTVTMVFPVMAYTRAFEIDTRIIGDANYKGVMDLENDIKKALGAKWPTLNGKAIRFLFNRTEFHIEQTQSGKLTRGVFIDVAVDFRTTHSART